ncbi:hypothetical protein C8R44DRAFT_441457 [Mycena epipterygia]|nr:hypothetical protein C8R44DRAFT_441457 [Mycena epipterygia]
MGGGAAGAPRARVLTRAPALRPSSIVRLSACPPGRTARVRADLYLASPCVRSPPPLPPTLPDRQDRVLHATFARRKRGLVKRVPPPPFVVSMLGLALALAGGVLEVRGEGHGEGGVGGMARRTERAARSTWCTWRRSSSLATRYDYPNRVRIFALSPRILSSLVIRHAPGRAFACSRCLFWTASFSSTLFLCAAKSRVSASKKKKKKRRKLGQPNSFK